jgi:hypothetical protein
MGSAISFVHRKAFGKVALLRAELTAESYFELLAIFFTIASTSFRSLSFRFAE